MSSLKVLEEVKDLSPKFLVSFWALVWVLTGGYFACQVVGMLVIWKVARIEDEKRAEMIRARVR